MSQLEVMPKSAEPNEVAAKAERTFMQKPQNRLFLILVVVAFVTGGYFIWHHYSMQESTDNAQIEGDIAPISARVSGTVKSVKVSENQFVEAGTVLAQLDPTDYEVALRRAEAELADARATSVAARSGVPITSTTSASQVQWAQAAWNTAGKQVDAARARLREAEANHVKAAGDLSRFKQLVDRDEISRQQFDAAVAAEKAAQAGVDSARAAVAATESQVNQAQAQVQSASTAPQQMAVTSARAGAALAQVQKFEAAVEQARLNLSYTTLRAPMSGLVSKKSVEPGQMLQAGQAVLAIVPLEQVWVVANFKENQLKNMHPGQPATIHVDAYNKDFEGHVDSIGAATAAKFSLLPPENATGNYVKVVQRIPVKIVFEKDQDPDHRLRPGMSVVPTVKTK